MALAVRDANGNVQLEPLYDPGFRAALAGMAYTTAKDIVQLKAAGGNVVRVKQVRVTVVAAAAAGDLVVELFKRTTLSTNGTPADIVAMPAVQMDANSSVATAVCQNISGSGGTVTNGTGTAIAATSVSVNATATIPSTATFTWDFTSRGDQPPCLRLATDALCVQLTNGGTTPTSATVTVEVAWEEAAQ